MIDEWLYAIYNYVTGIINTVANWIGTYMTTLATWLQQMVTSIISYLGEIVASIESWVVKVAEVLATWTAKLLETVTKALEELWDATLNLTTKALEKISEWLTNAWTTVKVGIETAFDAVVGFVQSAYQYLADLASSALSALSDLATSIASRLGAFIDGLLGPLGDGLMAVIARIQATYDAILGQGSSVLSSLTGSVRTLEETLAAIGAAFQEDLKTSVKAPFEAVKDAIEKMAKASSGFTDPAEWQGVLTTLDSYASAHTFDINSRDDAYSFFRLVTPTSTVGKLIWQGIFGVGMVVMLYSGIANAQAQIMLQEFGANHPYMLLPPADQIAAYRAGEQSLENAIQQIKMHGYSEASANRFMRISESVPALGDVLGLMHRGLLSSEQVDQALLRLGFTNEWAHRLREASLIIPPVSDLIEMAVKEVFDPSVSGAFGQFEEFPEVFGQWAEKQGLSEEWARRYWAAHWKLPSAQMGIEMFHRQIIDGDALNLLLRSLDVMPFWRDRIRDLSYNVLTRVDIRRMHALGVLTDADLPKAHTDLGYSPEDASQLSEFVLRLNKGSGAEDPLELGKTTRSQIVGWYDDGFLDRDTAKSYLLAIGLTTAAAEVYVSQVDIDNERAERKAAVEVVLLQAQVGTLSWDDAQAKLGSLGLTTVEIDKALAQLERARKANQKLPSIDDAKAWAKAKILDESGFRDLLTRLGYGEPWQTYFVRHAGLK